MFPKIGGFPPKSSTLMGFSIIFTIHFGGNTPIFGNTHIGWTNEGESVVSTQKMPPTRAIFLRKKMVRIVCLEAFTSVDKNIIRLDILPNLTSSVSQIFPEPQKSSDNIPHDFKQRYQLLLKVKKKNISNQCSHHSTKLVKILLDFQRVWVLYSWDVQSL